MSKRDDPTTDSWMAVLMQAKALLPTAHQLEQIRTSLRLNKGGPLSPEQRQLYEEWVARH